MMMIMMMTLISSCIELNIMVYLSICRALVLSECVTLNKTAFYFLFVIYKLKWKEEVPAVTTTTTHLQCRAVYCATCFRLLLKVIIRHDKNTCSKIACILTYLLTYLLHGAESLLRN